jgi:hypothetical protein
MSPRKPTPTATPEGFYNVNAAVVRLGLAQDENDTTGRRWLRDGCNRKPEDGKGKPFPHSRLNGQLVFSESDLAEIYDMHRNAPTRRGRARGSRVTRKPGGGQRIEHPRENTERIAA